MCHVVLHSTNNLQKICSFFEGELPQDFRNVHYWQVSASVVRAAAMLLLLNASTSECTKWGAL
jgi:hypothetical protein